MHATCFGDAALNLEKKKLRRVDNVPHSYLVSLRKKLVHPISPIDPLPLRSSSRQFRGWVSSDRTNGIPTANTQQSVHTSDMSVEFFSIFAREGQGCSSPTPNRPRPSFNASHSWRKILARQRFLVVTNNIWRLWERKPITEMRTSRYWCKMLIRAISGIGVKHLHSVTLVKLIGFPLSSLRGCRSRIKLDIKRNW